MQKCSMQHEPMSGWAGPIMRLVLGVTLLWSFIPRLADPSGFVALVNQMGVLPTGLGTFYGTVVPYLATVLAVLLLLGWFNKWVSALTALLFLSFILAIGFMDLGAPIPNKDFGYLALSLSLFFGGAGYWSVDTCHECA
ncbi:MAG: hypothetical protein A2788_02015 [Candidatus Abawacabacteria bacterium RIFCSPHIGHO2_01_FULL_46_8]|uniref:Methylamine utilisation protein MauE domain-containing protein n=1 Tax=Candidatus Abawacabacteria bacterium RIFCSPHIGHO2_01_FULL_46_8 TaxID=1817815 RepID=A0A1F4XIS2_9BACT|nr:MAG: hypothetical protein A2788_02015 [Candidatus Abawacabacteria bacterium RIFCSPHIGHO2_01_FULL_46_8]